MRGNLAETAHAVLTAARAPGAGAPPLPYARLDGSAGVVADVCVRGDLGFVLLLHRRKDGALAEELFHCGRTDTGAWGTAEHLSGGLLGVEATSPRDIEAALAGRPMALWGESETLLFTGRPGGDEGHQLLRFQTLLVREDVGHLDVRDVSSRAGSAPARLRKPLLCQVALLALLPEERVTVRAVARDGAGARFLGEPFELTGTAAVSGRPWA
ncbi:hypothetical protein [Streptomyces salyersiae]|uniref:Nudix hydrolase domain-containing protein n=1 Tax=Streptomyces salyersiae TaxID=3075530 RepID=A0ABU2RJA4_9ACTN|nr:hypothetical protein [Streptomyces sp. DSM 41770]MDT0428911.1 hypothetical protein [Streptomyces sp. DSM 41770]